MNHGNEKCMVIHARRDGSIDFAFYEGRARSLRSAAFLEGLRAIFRRKENSGSSVPGWVPYARVSGPAA